MAEEKDPKPENRRGNTTYMTKGTAAGGSDEGHDGKIDERQSTVTY